MDKDITIAAIVAIIAVIVVTLLINPFGSPAGVGEAGPADDLDGESDSEEGDDASEGNAGETGPESGDGEAAPPAGNGEEIEYENATYGVTLPEIEGDCTLYQNVAEDEYKCFGTAGNYSIMATNEYRVANESGSYFCKPTEYGCKLHQRVDLNQG